MRRKNGEMMKKVKAIEKFSDCWSGWEDERIIEAWEDESGRLWVEVPEWNSDWWRWVERKDLKKVEG